MKMARLNLVGQLRMCMLVLGAVLISSTLWAQAREITGTIVDAESSEPLIGASVVVKSSGAGAVTDVDGRFTVSAATGDLLVVSYVGYQTQEFEVGAENTMNINLKQGIDIETVVVTGYSAQSKKTITGSVSVVDAEELKALPTNGVDQALQGRVAGVQVTSSGEPGAGARVRIRGVGTFGNNEPLYIVDGVPLKGNLNSINPNDIESMQVLKDAAAASIYGARAGNGVVIITTKKGSVGGKSSLSFDSYYGTQVPTSLPEFVTPAQLAQLVWDENINSGLDQFSHAQYGSYDAANPTGPVLPDYLTPSGAFEGDPGTAASDYNYDFDDPNFNPITRANKNGTNWLDEIFDPAPIQSYNISATGGNQAGQYALSAGYMRQDGIVIHTNFERYSLRANTLFRIGDNIRIGENFTLNYSEGVGLAGGNQRTGNAITMAMRMPGIVPVYDIAGNFAGTNGGQLSNADNPVALLERGQHNKGRNVRAIGGAFLEVDIIEGLTAKTSMNVDLGTGQGRSFGIRNIEASEVSGSNQLNNNSYFNTTWTWYNTLQYNTSFGDGNNITVMAGTEAIEDIFEGISGSRIDFFSDDPAYRVLNAGNAGIQNGGYRGESSLFSIFGRVDYNYNEKYLISATLRRDGSSRFGPNNRYGLFPAVSVGWRVSDEPFLQDVSFINDLKIRASWGQTGNQDIGIYPFASTYGPSIAVGAYAINGANNSVNVGFESALFGNPDVKWETTTTTDIGFDALLLNDRLGVEFDWYNRVTEDLLLSPNLSTLQGLAGVAERNVGSMQNTGIDLGLNYNSPNTGDFTYSIGVNFSQYKNEVLSMNSDDQLIQGGTIRTFRFTGTQVGQPISSFYGYVVDGIFQNQAEVDAHATQDGAEPGRFKFQDTNGDGVIDGDDQTWIGNPHPDFFYGITGNLNFKGLDFSLFLQGVQGNELIHGNKYFTDFLNFPGNRSVRMLQAWHPDNTAAENAAATLPMTDAGFPGFEVGPSSYYIEDGSYLRIKNVTLGYTIPTESISAAGLSRLRIYVQANNLLTFTKYTGFDPDVAAGTYYAGGGDLDIGVDRGNYPVVRSLLFGINASF